MPSAKLTNWKTSTTYIQRGGASTFNVEAQYTVQNDLNTAIFILARIQGFGYDSGFMQSYVVNPNQQISGACGYPFVWEAGKTDVVKVILRYSTKGYDVASSESLAEWSQSFTMPPYPTVTVANGKLSLDATLDGTPVKATVVVEKAGTFKTPIVLTLPEGSYIVECSYGGYFDRASVNVKASQTTSKIFAFVSTVEETTAEAAITATANVLEEEITGVSAPTDVLASSGLIEEEAKEEIKEEAKVNYTWIILMACLAIALLYFALRR